MKKAFLHTSLRREIPTPFSTIETADALQKLGATVDRGDADWMPFKFQGEDYRIEGIIERWAGTESRIRLEGEVTLPLHNATLRSRLIIATVLISVIAAVAFVTPISMKVFGTDGMFTFINSHLFVALLVAIAVCIPIVKFLSHDPLAQRRWNAQQGLGNFAEKVAQLSENNQNF